MGKVKIIGDYYDEPTVEQKLDAIDISDIIEYVMNNAYDEVAERVMEEKVNGL